MKIGYARVSTATQNIEMQIDALKKEGCEIIYQEKKSAFSKRPELDNAIKSLRAGDTLNVWAFDRLGRNMLEVMTKVNTIQEKGANVYSISQKIDTGTREGKIMFINFSLFAEMEATLRKERAQAGIAMAREQGRPLGRHAGLTDASKKKSGLIKQMYMSTAPIYSISQICKELNVAKKTIYRCLQDAGIQLRGGLNIPGEKTEGKSE